MPARSVVPVPIGMRLTDRLRRAGSQTSAEWEQAAPSCIKVERGSSPHHAAARGFRSWGATASSALRFSGKVCSKCCIDSFRYGLHRCFKPSALLKTSTAAIANRCVSIILTPACPLQVWICVPNGAGGPALGASLFRWRRSQRGYH